MKALIPMIVAAVSTVAVVLFFTTDPPVYPSIPGTDTTQVTVSLSEGRTVGYICGLKSGVVLANVAAHNYTCEKLPLLVDHPADVAHEFGAPDTEWVFLNMDFGDSKAYGFRCMYVYRPQNTHYHCIGVMMFNNDVPQPQGINVNEA